MKKTWTEESWEGYLALEQDKRHVKMANALVKDIEGGGYEGIGKQEP